LHNPVAADRHRWGVVSPKRLTLREVMTISILFHLSGYRCFKWYYQEYVSKQLARYFPPLVSYNRFVEL
jgi:hypothetical protein